MTMNHVEQLAEGVTLYPGDCLEYLAAMPENSVDAIVTDPPYGIAFMGKAWDAPDNVAFRQTTWAKALRVLKPGGHLVAFSAPRCAHRMVCAIEEAGFEIRDGLMWVFGTGFPKSLDVSKAIDKAAGAEREVICVAGKSGSARSCMAGDFAGGEYMETSPATDEAKQWAGWGTALKPAYEPICLARKPLGEASVAANVLKWGTGAINVDGCRLPTAPRNPGFATSTPRANMVFGKDERPRPLKDEYPSAGGRWPANLCHDGSDEVLAAFPVTGPPPGSYESVERSNKNCYGGGWRGTFRKGHASPSGSAARFFYCAKASPAERAGSRHPTVKPRALMRWLVRMVTPPGGVVLDPFAGTGTTGDAALLEGFKAVLMERAPEFQADIRARIAAASEGAAARRPRGVGGSFKGD